MYLMTLLFSTLFSCTQMDDPGTPFSSVQIEKSPQIHSIQSHVDTSKDNISQEDVSKKHGEQKEIQGDEGEQDSDSSFVKKDELLVVSTSKEEQSSPDEISQKPPSEQDATSPKSAEQVEEANVDAPSQVIQNVPLSASNQWPLRLVKTEMQLNPPRAILGLPNGEEIVIRSGSFIEEHKLVVMGIGSRTVSLAKVHAQGDHAKIETIQLFSLND